MRAQNCWLVMLLGCGMMCERSSGLETRPQVKDGQPASPFRTDDWPGITEGRVAPDEY